LHVFALRPHPEERRLRRVSKDGVPGSWFETAQERLLTMRRKSILHDSNGDCHPIACAI
jgi:hypothetical protein